MKKKQQQKVCINLPDSKLPHTPLTREHMHSTFEERFSDVYGELFDALKLLKGVERSVTFFGSSRLTERNAHYKQARRLATRLAESGFTVITGGGPGIMEAANRGALDVNARSIGFNIELPEEQNLNPYTTENLGFHYFFTRKVALSFAAEAYIYFPGGFGTLDEFFEILTLVQTGKIPPVPIILVGRDYWDYVERLIKHELYEDHRAIDVDDMHLYTITDDEERVIEIVNNAPVRDTHFSTHD